MANVTAKTSSNIFYKARCEAATHNEQLSSREGAADYARHKQEYIYQREHRQVVLQHWYLVKLTEEYVRSLAFSKFTMDLCRTLQDMEKEHPIINQSAPTNNHIVAVPAL